MGNFNLIKLSATESTNDYLKKRRSQGNCQDGDLIWAKDQTAGRGQGDKSWKSMAGKSLTFSIYRAFDTNTPQHPFEISSAVTHAMLQGLHQLGIPDLSVKWPNDILSCDQKIGGILIENTFKSSQLKETIVGIGLNINQENFQSLPNAASLFSVTQKKWNLETVLEILLACLEKELFCNFLDVADSNLAEFNANLWRRDTSCTFDGPRGNFQAIPLGVTREGKLLLFDQEKKKEEEIDLTQARMCYDK